MSYFDPNDVKTSSPLSSNPFLSIPFLSNPFLSSKTSLNFFDISFCDVFEISMDDFFEISFDLRSIERSSIDSRLSSS